MKYTPHWALADCIRLMDWRYHKIHRLTYLHRSWYTEFEQQATPLHAEASRIRKRRELVRSDEHLSSPQQTKQGQRKLIYVLIRDVR
jgi:hypothetical protein